jgi:hypothetical protein
MWIVRYNYVDRLKDNFIQQGNGNLREGGLAHDWMIEFVKNGVGFTPKSFAKSLGINPDDYVEVTSFTFFPFYTQGLVPVFDNWRKLNFYNVPLDDLKGGWGANYSTIRLQPLISELSNLPSTSKPPSP